MNTTSIPLDSSTVTTTEKVLNHSATHHSGWDTNSILALVGILLPVLLFHLAVVFAVVYYFKKVKPSNRRTCSEEEVVFFIKVGDDGGKGKEEYLQFTMSESCCRPMRIKKTDCAHQPSELSQTSSESSASLSSPPELSSTSAPLPLSPDKGGFLLSSLFSQTSVSKLITDKNPGLVRSPPTKPTSD